MNPSSAYVAQFDGVIIPEAVLDTQGPIDGLRILHVWWIIRRGSCPGVRRRSERCNASSSRWQAAISEKVRSSFCKRRSVLCHAQLRWQRQNPDVVVVNVIRDSETST